MKWSALASMVLWSSLVFTNSSLALTINDGTIDVGNVDTRINTSILLHGDAAELGWVQSILGIDIISAIKNDNLTSGDWKQTSQTGTWAFPLSDSPDYFLVKTGNNRINNLEEYLFSNNETKSWAVLDLDDIYVTDGTNIGKVSYISEFNGSTAPVPEPSTLLLLGVGMFGLAFLGKRRINNT